MLVACVWAWGAASAQPPPPPDRPFGGMPRTPGFGHIEGKRPVRMFGRGDEAETTCAPEDLARATERIQQYDTNRDGFLDRSEAARADWRDDPFQFDLDRDQRLSPAELARRYAARRLGHAPGGPKPPPGPPPPGPSGPAPDAHRREHERRVADEAARRNAAPRATRESWHLADVLVGRYDLDRDGHLDAQERRHMGLNSLGADKDRDHRISRAELAEWLAEQEAEQGRQRARELPAWFTERDLNRDGQVQMSEFTDEWTDAKLQEFRALDLNGDGIIVAEECLRAAQRQQETHADHRFQIIPAKGIVRSTIEVAEKSLVADLDVRLAITHTHDDHLSAVLFGPEGQRVELFSNVGGQDDHFDNTILDEESPRPITRGAPTFAGRYQTKDFARGRPGLKQFYGRSMAGSWTLLIQANSDRPGIFHGWALLLQPVEGNKPPAGSKDFD
jgi:Ca2+-binding EF-hand superfamily protein